MNWPSLQNRTSEVLAEVLRNAVHAKPKDLFEYVAQALQEQSGFDPAAFEHLFEECKRKPRTYVLEDRCPAGQDPMAWVPMRFNDDTILSELSDRLQDLTSEIVSALPIDDTKGFLDRVCTAMPELMYVRANPSEPVASQSSFIGAELSVFQSLRGVYLCCSRCEPLSLDDEMVEFSFSCEPLAADSRSQLSNFSIDVGGIETLMVLLMLRALGSHEPFQRRFGGGYPDASKAVLHAIEHEVTALPSFFRLDESAKEVIKACLKAWFPLEMLYATEVVPGHFQSAKELLAPLDGGLQFFVCALVVDNLVAMRNAAITNEAVDQMRTSAHCLLNLDKHSPVRVYETMLKKRAEVHSWRIVRDDYLHKAVVRVCCFIGQEDTDHWNHVQNLCEELRPGEKEALRKELGEKDGCSELPAYVLLGAGRFMDSAVSNPDIGLQSAITLLARMLEDLARGFDKMASRSNRMVRVDIGAVSRRAREFTRGLPFEDLPFRFQETVSGIISVEFAGGS